MKCLFHRIFSLICIMGILLSLPFPSAFGRDYQQQLTDPKDASGSEVDIKSISMKDDKNYIYVKSESWDNWNMAENRVIVYAIYFNVKNTDTSEDCEYGFGVAQTGNSFMSVLMRMDSGAIIDMKNEPEFNLNSPIGIFSVKKSLLGLSGSKFSFFARIGFDNSDDRAPNQYGSVMHYKPAPSSGKPDLSIETNRIDFGQVLYNSKVSSLIKISNVGGGTLTGTVTTKNPALSLSYNKFDLEESETAEVPVTIYSSGLPTGDFVGEVTVTSNGGNGTISIQADILHQPEIVCDTEAIDFGSCFKGERKSEKIRIRNKFPGPIKGSLKAKSKWVIISQDEFDVNSIDITISLNSKILDKGHSETTLTISSNGGELTIPVTVEIQPLFDLSAEKLDFGSVVLEDTTAIPDQSVVIKNNSDDTQKLAILTEEKWLKVSLSTLELKKNTEKELKVSIDRKEIKASGYYTSKITLENKYDTIEIPVIVNVQSFPPKLIWLKENPDQEKISGEIIIGKTFESIVTLSNDGYGTCQLKAFLKEKTSPIRLFLNTYTLKRQDKTELKIKLDTSTLTATGLYNNTLIIESNGGDLSIPITINVLPKKEVVIVLTIGFQFAYINDQPMKLDAPPYIKQGSTMVPLRFISEAMKAEVKWENIGKGRILISMKEIAIQLDIGSTTALVNGKAVYLTAAPEIVQSRTFVPLRFVGESMGAQIEWEAASQKITLRFFED
ncbi:copper amine oxidase N-terminal domain-containing protein [bacterium]|nr:copper amine oxidase N-terminal domain-containing protein [bacterium]